MKGPTLKLRTFSTSICTEVEGCSDQGVIADKFATHFSGCFTGNNRVETLKMEYLQMRITLAFLYRTTLT